ncbi:MAG: 4Fe-4S dicluster domain-containing protein [Desulfitobacterium sp.]
MAKQLGFFLDVNRCLGCGTCIKACASANRLPSPLTWRKLWQMEDAKVDQGQISRFFLSTSCNHCANPECMRVCPSGAYAKRRDGIVLHYPDKCISCKSCVASCPFGAPQINPQTEKASKCQLCYEQIDRGSLPHCVQACVTGAIQLREIYGNPTDKLLRLTAPMPTLRLTRPSTFYYPPKGTKIL